MSITKERIDILTEFLNSDEERSTKLFALEANEAAEQINYHGHNFTADELRAYGKLLETQLEDGVLEGVAGGIGKGIDNYMSLDSVHASAGSVGMVVVVVAYGVGVILSTIWR